MLFFLISLNIEHTEKFEAYLYSHGATTQIIVSFEVLSAVRMTMLFFWVVTPCRLVSIYQRFGEIYCIHLQG
jgi:hypothetical protein